MVEKILKLILSIMGLLIMFVILGCYDPFADQEIKYPRGMSSYDDVSYYSFDPEIVFTSLDQGNGKIFQPLSGAIEKNILSPGSFAWQQQDYLKIVSALHQVNNVGSLDDWGIYAMIFSRNCADNQSGFDTFSVTYFQTYEERYVTQSMSIYPLRKEAIWGGGAYFPHPLLVGWESIDLNELKITADDALRIAEESGGKETRLVAKNQCEIVESLSYNLDQDGWTVFYYDSKGITLFQIVIDPYSGKFEIIDLRK